MSSSSQSSSDAHNKRRSSGSISTSWRRRSRSSGVEEALWYELQRLREELAREREKKKQQGQRSVGLMLIVSYGDLLSDLVLAMMLLFSSQWTFGVVSLGIIGFSLLMQVLLVKFFGGGSWFSKEVLFTAICLGPLLEVYREYYGEPPRRAGAQSSSVLLALLKAAEVACETLPHLILQLTMLTVSPEMWGWSSVLISLGLSIVAAAVLIVDAENTINGGNAFLRRVPEYWGYLPVSGGQRSILLLSMVLFTGSYLVLAASSIAVASRIFPLSVVAAVIAADCGLHHLMRAAEGEWWVLGDAVRSGVGTAVVDAIAGTALWTLTHACPMATCRTPDWAGPRSTARIVVCSLLEGSGVVCAALLMLPREHSARTMAEYICLPALCTALAALTSFFAAMEPRYRHTFWAHDSRKVWHCRHFHAWLGQWPYGDADIALLVARGSFQRYVGEPVSVWIEQQAAVQPRPAWLTAEWQAAALRHAHLLPGNGAVRAAEALGGNGAEAAADAREAQGTGDMPVMLALPTPTPAVQSRPPTQPTNLWSSELEA
jgi:hypothetical protein